MTDYTFNLGKVLTILMDDRIKNINEEDGLGYRMFFLKSLCMFLDEKIIVAGKNAQEIFSVTEEKKK